MRTFTYVTMLCTAAVATAAASPALAVTGGPPIAYASQSGYTFSVYLANPDGTGVVKIYTGANKVNVPFVDLRPGGNEITIQENSGTRAVLKIIDYSDTGAVTNTRTVPNNGCTVQGFDYHPTDGSLLVSRYCNNVTVEEVRRYDPATGAWDANPLVSYGMSNPDKAANGVRWLGDGSGFLWANGDTVNNGRIDRFMLSNPGTPVTVYATGGADIPNWFDVARCAGTLDSSCNKMLVTDISGGLHLITMDDFGGTDQGIIYTSAADGHFSPDNAHVLWRLQTKSTYQLKIDNNVFLSKGTFGGKDWRQ